MGEIILRRSSIELMTSLLNVIAGVLFALVGNFYLRICGLAIICVHSFAFYRKFSFHELEFKDGMIYFLVNKSFFLRRECICVNKVVSVYFREKKVGGICRMLDVPSVVFIFAEGEEIEYSPNVHPGKRFDEIMSFFYKVPGLPPVLPKPEG